MRTVLPVPGSLLPEPAWLFDLAVNMRLEVRSDIQSPTSLAIS
jgi:hypothetical protein